MSHDSEAMALHEYIYVFVLLVRCSSNLGEQTCSWLCQGPLELRRPVEKTALSAAIHKDHDGEVEHDDDCAHEGYHGYDDHDADGHDSDNDDDDDDDNDG